MRAVTGTAITTVLVVILSACSDVGDVAADSPSDPLDELTLHGNEFCPETMPRAPQETYGFGTEVPATELPAFPTFDDGWICTYQTQDTAPRGSNGAWYEWVRTASPQQLDSDQIVSFSDAISELELVRDAEYACTDDLGPRFLVTLARERDLTGVVIDDYGCGSVRLTDDPFVTVPGDASQPGTVSGVLEPPEGLLADLGVERAR